jgi:hypothetical protein
VHFRWMIPARAGLERPGQRILSGETHPSGADH